MTPALAKPNMAIAEKELVLRDIHLPATPEMWPPAPGWWLLAVLIIAGAWLAYKTIGKQLRNRRHQKDVVALLDALPVDEILTPIGISRLSSLLKRLALVSFPERDVASLSGEKWLEFLDETGGEGEFQNGVGRVLSEGQYRPSTITNIDNKALAQLVRRWLHKNVRGSYGS